MPIIYSPLNMEGTIKPLVYPYFCKEDFMKKTLAILLALVVVGGAAFAQVTFNGYERTVVTAKESGVSVANRVRLNMSFTDADGNFGFWGRLQNADTAAPTMKYAYGWVNLADKKVKLTAGILGNYDYTIGSGVSDLQLGNLASDNYVFDATEGILAQFFPVEGLNIGVAYIPDGSWSGAADMAGWSLDAKYAIKDIGNIVVSSLTAAELKNSFVSGAFDFTGVKDLEAAVGYMYGGTAMWHAEAAGTSSVYGLIDYSSNGIAAQVAPIYNLTASTVYVEGYVGYTAGAFTANVIGAYDQSGANLGADAADASYALDTTTGLVKTTAAKAAVPSTYLVGLELNYKVGKSTLMSGIYYDDATAWSVPVYVRVNF
jgi:hypothetical protein